MKPSGWSVGRTKSRGRSERSCLAPESPVQSVIISIDLHPSVTWHDPVHRAHHQLQFDHGAALERGSVRPCVQPPLPSLRPSEQGSGGHLNLAASLVAEWLASKGAVGASYSLGTLTTTHEGATCCCGFFMFHCKVRSWHASSSVDMLTECLLVGSKPRFTCTHHYHSFTLC